MNYPKNIKRSKKLNSFDFNLSASTKHCVVQGSGQDRELEVEQSIRTATEQKEQKTYTNLGFNPLSLEAVQNVPYNHWSGSNPVFSIEFLYERQTYH